MEKAIKKAMEGGWKNKSKGSGDWIIHSMALIDPLFWQALGKSLEWGKDHLCWECGAEEGGGYKAHWHSFIEHLTEGKDINSFFDELLK